MPSHVNFYENLKEAQMRLSGTIVLYDKLPYTVVAICSHNADGIFRIYLDPVGRDPSIPHIYPMEIMGNTNSENPTLGLKLDAWLSQNPATGIIRKQMNSPLFDKYRPFPLGMCNINQHVYYVERQPTRKTEQGLTPNMLTETRLELMSSQPSLGRDCRAFHSPNFLSCITGKHPPAQDCLTALQSEEYANEGLAFHREFALLKGPISLVFLAYKNDVVGVLPKGDFSYLKLDPKFIHVKEAVDKLSLFDKIIQ